MRKDGSRLGLVRVYAYTPLGGFLMRGRSVQRPRQHSFSSPYCHVQVRTLGVKDLCRACLLVAMLVVGCVTQRHATGNAEQEVRALLDQQVADWNAGNLAGFMQGYARSDSTRFASGGDVLLGWQTVFERYRRKYGDKETM